MASTTRAAWGRAASGRWLLLLAWAAALVAPARVSAEERVIPPGKETALQALLADVGWNEEREAGYRFGRMSIQGGVVTIGLERRDGAAWAPAGSLTLTPAAGAEAGARTSESFALAIEAPPDDPAAATLLEAAAASVIRHDAGDLYVTVGAPPASETPAERSTRWLLSLLLLWGLAVAADMARQGVRPGAQLRVRITHLLPATIQCAVFTYWALWWPDLRAYLPWIAGELAFGFGVQCLLSLWRQRRLDLSFGFVPVVLSTNLFVQFSPGEIHLAALVIVIALVSRALIQRHGKHVFNPSAFGVSVVGVIHLAFPELGYGDISRQLALAPNMTEVMLLLALVVQLRIPIVLLSLGALAGLVFVIEGVGFPVFSPWWPAVFIVITLLATDPATIPKSAAGRLLSGLVLGLLLGLAGFLLDAAGVSDFYGKVLPVPLVNLFAGAFDKLAARLPRWLVAPLAPRFNVAHVVIWVGVVAWGLLTGAKERFVEPDLMQEAAVPGVVIAADGGVTCTDNPAWCEGFSFAEEWRLRVNGEQGKRPP